MGITVMVTAAITALKERGGSSLKAILKYIVANYKIDDLAKAQVCIKLAVRKMLAAKKLVPVKGSFKPPMVEKVKKVKKTKKPMDKKVVKKQAAKKVVKKTVAAKKAAKKPAAKKTAVKKPAKKAPVAKVARRQQP